jgi:hypothetical protein
MLVLGDRRQREPHRPWHRFGLEISPSTTAAKVDKGN